MVRRLILNADDYGHCAEINDAVEELISAGRLRDVSVLANGDLWAASAQFLRRHPHISAGAHLNAVEGRPVSPASEVRPLIGADGVFVGLRSLMALWMLHPQLVSRALEIEWRAQLQRLRDAGLELSHADSHQHLHAFPPAWKCAVKLCAELGIPALRLPLERNALPMRRAGAFALGASLTVSALTAYSRKLRHNDHFLGFKRAGLYGLEALLADLKTLQPGVTEIALHPSTADNVPYPHLLGDGERRALLSSSLPEQCAAQGIELTTWREIV